MEPRHIVTQLPSVPHGPGQGRGGQVVVHPVLVLDKAGMENNVGRARCLELQVRKGLKMILGGTCRTERNG